MKHLDQGFLDEVKQSQFCLWCWYQLGVRTPIDSGVDPHHLVARGMGGGARLDIPLNIMPLCRVCHLAKHYGTLKQGTLWIIQAQHFGFAKVEDLEREIYGILNDQRARIVPREFTSRRIHHGNKECNQGETDMQEITIMPELRDLLKALTKNQKETLRENLKENGCDPLTVWEKDGQLVLADGHHRYEICVEEGIPFEIKKKKFESLEKVKEWVRKMHIGRRNLSKKEESYERGLAYNLAKGKRGGNRKTGSKGQNVLLIEAGKQGVSEKQIARDAVFQSAVDRLMPELKEAATTGSLPKKKAIELSTLGKDDQKAAVLAACPESLGRAIRVGQKPFTDALPYAKKARIPNTNGKVDQPSEDNPIFDKAGNPIPSGRKSLLDVFGDQCMADCLGKVKEANKLLRSVWKWNNFLDMEGVHDRLQWVITHIDQQLPHAVHAACDGAGCKNCQKHGWVPRWRMDELKKQHLWQPSN